MQGLQCLVELAKEEYQNLLEFINDIRQITVTLVESKNYKIGA